MRIHTDKPGAVGLAIYKAGESLPGVGGFNTYTTHRSRTHETGIELRLTGNGAARNTGNSGADPYVKTATWDEYGVVIAAIFEADPDAVVGSVKRPIYADAEHFHWSTGDRFKSGELPDDTHYRHTWDRQGWDATKSYTIATCKRCSALTRRGRTWFGVEAR